MDLMIRRCTTWFFATVAILHGQTIAEEPSVRNAVAAIFADAHVRDSALDVHSRALAMIPDQRYEFLSRWVLPTEDHATLRLQVGFTSTYPAPTENADETQQGKRIGIGGEIVCPALDLIETAKQTGKLNAVSAAIETIEPRNRIEEKNVFAFRCLVALATDDVDEAVKAGEEVFKRIIPSDPYDDQHRVAEMLLIHAAGTDTRIRDVVVDYVARLFSEGRWPTVDNVWSRQLAKLAFKLIPVMPEDQNARAIVPVSKSPRYWTPVAHPMSWRRGFGLPVAEWVFGGSQAINVANHGDDVVYFNIPLLGDITVEADTTVSAWREAEMLVGAQWVAPSYSNNSYDVGTIRRILSHNEIDRINQRSAHWYRHRTHIVGSEATVSLDGLSVHRETFPNVRDPWIGIRSRMLNEGGGRGVKISGSPVVPEQLDLIAPGLDAWIDYYANDEPWSRLPWTLTNSEIHGRLRTEMAGSICEQALFYHRPMLEDGTIEYEFFYLRGKSCAYPAIDRLCFLLDEKSVGLHWLTDGRYEQTSAAPNNRSSLPGKSAIPLLDDKWNHMRVNLKGDVIQLILNGLPIAERKLEATNQRFFGLFHYADQQQLQVRNIRWRGNWPRELPLQDDDELAEAETDFLDTNRDHLTAFFRHNFAKQGMPPELFRIAVGQLGKDVMLTPQGLLTQAVTSRVSSVAFTETVGGDFDIFAHYTAFKGAAEGGGARLMTRMQSIKFDEVIGGRKHFIYRPDFQENVGFLWHGYSDGGPYRWEYDKGQNIEETAGTVRLSRRGDTIYILTAEDGSDYYRLHMKQKAGTEDLSAGGVQLQCEMPGARMIWTDLEIRAERIQDSQQVIARLNHSRDELVNSTVMDFAKSRHGEFYPNSIGTTWISGKGLRIQHSSEFKESSIPIEINLPLVGDFDADLALEIETLTTPSTSDSSLLAFQIAFPDPEHTRYQAVLYRDSNATTRLVVHQQCVPRGTGKDESFETHSVVLDSLTSLRIARRGENVTICGTSPACGGEFVLAQFHRPDFHLPGKLNLFIHAGAPDAEISVLLKKLVISSQPDKPLP